MTPRIVSQREINVLTCFVQAVQNQPKNIKWQLSLSVHHNQLTPYFINYSRHTPNNFVMVACLNSSHELRPMAAYQLSTLPFLFSSAELTFMFYEVLRTFKNLLTFSRFIT